MNWFALLDDRAATTAKPTSRLYTGLARECRCEDPVSLESVWAEAEREMRAGRHAVILADYEWGARLVGAGDQGWGSGEQNEGAGEPGALRLLLFTDLRRLSSEEVDRWLAAREAEALAGGAGLPSASDPAPAGVFNVHPSLGAKEFSAALDRIQALILAGETYQVNFTYRLDFQTFGSPFSLYRRLRTSQPVPFGAFLALPPGPGTGGGPGAGVGIGSGKGLGLGTCAGTGNQVGTITSIDTRTLDGSFTGEPTWILSCSPVPGEPQEQVMSSRKAMHGNRVLIRIYLQKVSITSSMLRWHTWQKCMWRVYMMQSICER